MNKKHFTKYMLDMTNIGTIKNPTIIYEYKSSSCGDTFLLHLLIKNEKIIDVKYKIYGCPGIMCGCAVTSEYIKNLNIKDILNIEEKEILNYLENLPDDYKKCSLTMLKILKNDIFVKTAQK